MLTCEFLYKTLLLFDFNHIIVITIPNVFHISSLINLLAILLRRTILLTSIVNNSRICKSLSFSTQFVGELQRRNT